MELLERSIVLALAVLVAVGMGRARRIERRVRRALDEVRRLDREIDTLRRCLGLAETSVRFHAQFGEDLVIWTILDRPRHGFFVEAGAYDGLTLSVTSALERVGWKGLLVEANPEAARRCRSNRPGTRVIEGALAPRSGPLAFEVVRVSRAGGAGETDEWLSRLADLDCAREELPGGARLERVTAQGLTLDEVLADAPARFDLLVLDLEGGEWGALAGWDARERRARLALVEDLRKKAEIGAWMRAAGYAEAGALGCSTLYVAEEERLVAARARAVLQSRGEPAIARDEIPAPASGAPDDPARAP